MFRVGSTICRTASRFSGNGISSHTISKTSNTVILPNRTISRWAAPRQFSTFVTSADGIPNIRLTESAVEELKNLEKRGHTSTLRLKVNSGGCSGFEYSFELYDFAKNGKLDSDVCIEQDGVRMVIDKESVPMLEEVEIDYKIEMIKSAFQVSKNKLADQNCSCGSSFSVAF